MTLDFNPGWLDGDGCVDLPWVYVRTPKWVGWVVSVTVVVALGEPRVFQPVDDDGGNGYGVCDGFPVLGLVSRSGGDSKGRGFVRCTSGLLNGRTWVIVVTVVYGETSCSCPCESGDNGTDLELLTGYIVESRVVLKWFL